MSEDAGRFVWYEWMGADPEAAGGFYSEVVGWKLAPNDMAGFPYWIALAGEAGVGGLMATPEAAKGAPPCWTGYVAVDDVDAAVAKLQTAGGHTMRAPWDIPNVGRAAFVSDAQGAPFMLFRPNGAGMPPPAPGAAGQVGWRELHALDGEAALEFYSNQFGWREIGQHDMGPMGVYRLFSAGAQEGGMMTKAPQGPGPIWLYYFVVEAAEAANARVTAKGGKVLNGPHEVPGGMFASQCADPEGAMFGLVSTKR